VHEICEGSSVVGELSDRQLEASSNRILCLRRREGATTAIASDRVRSKP
jgi:hypothetical protein